MSASVVCSLLRTDTYVGKLLLCGWLLLLPTACNRAASDPAAADAGAAAPSVDAGDSATAGDSAGPASASPPSDLADDGLIEVPDGTPEELLAFLREAEVRELGLEDGGENGESPEPPTPEAQGRAIRRLMRARITACDKILARPVPEDTRMEAIGLKLDALRTLAATEPDQYAQAFDEYLQSLLKGSDPFLARKARVTQFQTHVNDWISTPDGDPEPLMTELRSLLADENAGPETMTAARDAFTWAFNQGQIEVAARGFQMIGERFQASGDENIAAEAQSLSSQAIFLQLSRLTEQAAAGKPEAPAALLAKLRELIAPERLDPSAQDFAMQTAFYFELSGDYGNALQAYEMIDERFRQGDDPALAANIAHSVALAKRRLGLIGNELPLQGVQLNGSAFDWQTYRGKWVVVCFWTTWHEGWADVARHIRKSIAPYRDPSVEVVSISLDDNRADLERYLREFPANWPVLVDADPTRAGFENENATRCGVEAVPFVLLVDPTGKVVEIHVTQKRLEDGLTKHLGPIAQ